MRSLEVASLRWLQYDPFTRLEEVFSGTYFRVGRENNKGIMMKKKTWSLKRRLATLTLGLICLSATASAARKDQCNVLAVGIDSSRFIVTCEGESSNFYGYDWNYGDSCVQRISPDSHKSQISALHAALLSGKKVNLDYVTQFCGGTNVNVVQNVWLLK